MTIQLQHEKKPERIGRFRTACSVMLDVAANKMLNLGSKRIHTASLKAHEERPVLARAVDISASCILVPDRMLVRILKFIRALAWKAIVRLGIRDRIHGAREFAAADGTRFSVRPFQKKDAAECSEMIRTAYLRKLLSMEEDMRQSFLTKTSEAKIPYSARAKDWFVAECEGKAIGAIGIIRWAWHSGELIDFCVDEDFQRKGIGSILASAYIAQKRLEGVEYLSARCLEPSRRILLKLGFRDWGPDGEYCKETLKRMSSFLDSEVMLLVRGEMAASKNLFPIGA